MVLKSNVQSLALPLMVDEDEAAASIAEPGGMNWKEGIGHYTARLKEYLDMDG